VDIDGIYCEHEKKTRIKYMINSFTLVDSLPFPCFLSFSTPVIKWKIREEGE
jgi:hypothetical protein